jgi:nuclear protein localization family protein 4
MLLRIRNNVGVWRVDQLDDRTATVSDVLDKIAKSRPHVQYQRPLCFDPKCEHAVDTTKTLAEQNLTNGTMIYCQVDPTTCADQRSPDEMAATNTTDNAMVTDATTTTTTHNNKKTLMKRVIGKDGMIRMVPTNEVVTEEDRGFRKGLLPLRDIKMQWTLSDFTLMDSQYVFKIQRQEAGAVCSQVSLDTFAVQDFSNYLRRFNFTRARYGYLYGKYVNVEPNSSTTSTSSDDNDKTTKTMKQRAIVEAIYEPPQEADPSAAEGFVMLDDPREETVTKVAQMLGLQKVGWIFGHDPQRRQLKTPYVLSSAEIIMAAELQLEAADGVNETPFVTVKVTLGDDDAVAVEAFQVSQQCMAMAAEQALEIDATNLGVCRINDTFTAVQEGKDSKTVDNNFFLCVVPIVQHTSELLIQDFPKLNRDHDNRTPSQDELKRQLSKSGTAGWTLIDVVADFSLLLYLAQFLDVNTDFPKICASIVHRDLPLDDGYKLIIAGIAGMDGSY